ncbi:hypothetical protein LPJ53_003530 [Coemansia erecta]|uniref:BZIP domain-containing protein n=1 Tax=Coemansia erecta TaxID=147472 RepID=A0A9W7Y0G5_9FUNG|nr:hypothetical protein LPJ53_003530 [Coemansia erecta]
MSASEQHAYPPRFPSSQAPASAWGRSDTHYRQRPMALPTPSPHAGFQQPQPHQPQHQPQHHQQHSQQHSQQAQKAGGWGGIAGYMAGGPPLLPPPASYSRSTTVSPPAPLAPHSAPPVSSVSSQQTQHQPGGLSPYSLPPLSAPITPLHPPSPPPYAPPAAKPSVAAKRRRQQQRNASGSPAASAKRSRSPDTPSSPPPSQQQQPETEAARILEERRRRNASASARFRKRRNERERELLARCMFLEQQLLGSVGARAFDEIMRKAPAAQGLDGPVGLGARRGASGTAASSRAPSPRDDESEAEQGCAGMSVCALTAPRSVDDVWAAYMALSQQVAGAVQRIGVLESASK